MLGKDDVRRAVVDGQFYPGNAAELGEDIDRMLEESEIADIQGDSIALVAPHAGYMYSGQTAAAAYKQVKGQTFDAVVVIAPSHRELFSGASVYNKGGYETPLGVVPVEAELADAIIDQDDAIHFTMAGHRNEHALEVQVPFLQRTLEEPKIVPIVMAERSPKLCRTLADAIVAASQGKHILMVASSDLYHGYSYEACVETDARTLEVIEAFDPDELCRGLDGPYQACGGGPIATLLMAAKQMGADQVEVVARTNSNDVTGSRGGYVVGYGAAVVYRSTG